jgi:hypothetical protein
MNIHEYTAPSHWACYLINDDCTGMDARDKRACDNWAATLSGPVVSCTSEEDENHAGMMRWHDAASWAPYTADCAVYTVLETEADSSWQPSDDLIDATECMNTDEYIAHLETEA